MMFFSFVISWSPVLLLIVLAVFFRYPALKLSLWGAVFSYKITALFCG